MNCLIATKQRHPELGRQYEQRVVEPRREVMRQVLRRGVETGELRPDLDVGLALRLITSPMILLTMAERPGQEPEADLPARIVDLLLEGLTRR